MAPATPHGRGDRHASVLTDAPLHIGLGRGNARWSTRRSTLPWRRQTSASRNAWPSCAWHLQGEPFTYHGKYLRVPREVRLRPTPRLDRLTFLGAIGQPSSGAKYARLGLPPMLTGHSPLAAQRDILAAWDDTARRQGGDLGAPKVGSSILVMADTDREAEALARRYVPRWYQLQVEHYAFDAERHANVPGYQPFHETHKRRQVYCDPDNLGPLIDASMIGSAETVRAKLQRLLDVGYSYVILIPSIPSVPAGAAAGLADTLRPRRDAAFSGADAPPRPQRRDKPRGRTMTSRIGLLTMLWLAALLASGTCRMPPTRWSRSACSPTCRAWRWTTWGRVRCSPRRWRPRTPAVRWPA